MGGTEQVDAWSVAGRKVTLRLPEDASSCWLSVGASRSSEKMTETELLESLGAHGVTEGIDSEAITRVVEAATTGCPIDNILVANGLRPVPPKDAEVEFKVIISRDVPHYEQDPAQAADFHHAHLFENVHAGQVIAVFIPAVAGTPGQTVGGHVIPVPEPNQEASVKLGQGVELRGGTEYVATQLGRVVLEAGCVSVTDELRMKGDVDFGCGDIDFIGSVQVAGNIADSFKVRGGLSVVIEGTAGNCVIESDGDIRLAGMIGLEGDQGEIRCGGNLTAKYLREVQVECEGDLTVQNEVMNCIVHCGGVVSVPGLIAGGEIIAQQGIEVGRVGSVGGVRTVLAAGVNYRLREDLKEVESGLGIIRAEWEELRERLAARGFQAEPDAEYEKLHQQVNNLAEEYEQLETQIDAIREEFSGDSNAKINVTKAIFEGVDFHLGKTRHKMTVYRRGECSIIEHHGRELSFLEMSPLRKNAIDLETDLCAFEALDGHGMS